MTKVRKKEFSGLLSPQEFNSDRVLVWAKSEDYKVAGGWISPKGNETEFIFPLSDPGLFLSFARLGARGEPSERSIQGWAKEHGLLEGKDSFRDSWPDERAKVFSTQEESDQFIKSRIKEKAMKLEDFRTEVRFANQLLNLYADVRAQNLPAIRGWFTVPPDYPRLARQTPIDRYLESAWNSPFGGKHEVALAKKDIQSLPEYYGSAVKLLMSSASYAVRSVRLSVTDWDLLERPPTLSRILDCPDLLSAMYLQFYLLVTNHKPMRRCENPACRLPFPVTRKDRYYCNATCRSNARNYR
jgi:hypothetical protein